MKSRAFGTVSTIRLRIGIALFAFLLMSSLVPELQSARAQSVDASAEIDEGILAFREDRFQDAERHFQAAVEANGANAEAHFLLARIYFETPLKNRRAAQRSLNRALELEPDNLQFMVANLLQLREDSWSFMVDKLRESKRQTLALEILAKEPTNAYANEELGILYIRDFWRYRNAIQIPGFDLARRYKVPGGEADRGTDSQEGQITDPGDLSEPSAPAEASETLFDFADPQQVFLADEFDIDALEKHGIPFRDLSRRAARVYERAVNHLNVALETNPRHRSIYDQLMKVYALRGDYAAALTMLEQMYVYYPDDPGLWIYLGMANYKSGNPEAASKTYERAMETLDEKTRAAYNDIRFLLNDDERKRYDENPVNFQRDYWTSKDPRYLTPYNERRIEHYTRVAYADLLYGAPTLDIRGWDTERGQILIRYGVPKSDIVIVPDRSIDDTGIELASGTDDPLAARDESANSKKSLEVLNTYNIWDYGDFRFVFEDPFRTGEFRLYSPSAEALSQRALPWRNDYEISAKETFRTMPDRFVYVAPGRQIELPYLVNAFKGEDESRAELFIHYGIPLNSVDGIGDVIEVTAKEGTFLIGADRSLLSEERRTIYGLNAEHIRKFADASLWINTHQLKAPAGTHELSVELEIGSGSTVAVQRRSIDVPSFTGDNLQMSDVMLAYGVEDAVDGKRLSGADIVRKGYSISPAPWSVFATTQPIYLYFEFYNLSLSAEGESRYEMEAVLSKKDTSSGVSKIVKNVFGGREKGVSVRVPGSGRSADDGQYLILDVANEEPGLYTLLVKVTDSVTRKSVERTKDLFLE